MRKGELARASPPFFLGDDAYYAPENTVNVTTRTTWGYIKQGWCIVLAALC